MINCRQEFQEHQQFNYSSYLSNSSCICSVATHSLIWRMKTFNRSFLTRENGNLPNHFRPDFYQTLSLRSKANLPPLRIQIAYESHHISYQQSVWTDISSFEFLETRLATYWNVILGTKFPSLKVTTKSPTTAKQKIKSTLAS